MKSILRKTTASTQNFSPDLLWRRAEHERTKGYETAEKKNDNGGVIGDNQFKLRNRCHASWMSLSGHVSLLTSRLLSSTFTCFL